MATNPTIDVQLLRMVLPVRLQRPKGKKRYYLNLNEYRNAHYQLLNWMKVVYTELVIKQLTKKDVARFKACRSFTLVYTVYPFQRSDISNIGSIVDKFACDALVKAGVMPDDHMGYLTEVRYRAGSVDRANPRVELDIVGA